MFKIEAVATVWYTCSLSEEDSQKVIDYIKENPEEFEFTTNKDKIVKAVEKLYEENIHLIYNETVLTNSSKELIHILMKEKC